MTIRRVLLLTATLALAIPLLAACGGKPSSGASQTVTFAEQVGSPPTYIFPLYNGANSGNNNITYLQPLMWRPLYWFGHPGNDEPTINYHLSLAYPPTFSNGGKTVTIRMHHYVWSDGKPVTSRDVQFWMNLLRANRIDWGIAAPGGWLTHIVKMQFPSPYKFAITFDKAFNHQYLLDSGLSQITPVPQHAWDKTSASGPIGNYDMTTAGAHAVYKFLDAQSRALKTWDTNPLWQVVDGPWRLEKGDGFQVTGQTILVANPRYSGPDKPTIKRIEELPFTSASAEFNALMTGQVDYGYLPFTDVSRIPALRKQGFKIKPWLDWGFTGIQMNFHNPTVGPIFGQLYIRQAMQHLVNEQGIIKQVLRGYGVPSYGPMPVNPPNTLISAQQRHDPYPYDPAAARQLLQAHGWHVASGQVTTCVRPGNGPGECGAGIKAGTKLAFTLLYPSGDSVYKEEVETLRSDLLQAGIQVTAQGSPFTQVLSQAYQCQTLPPAKCPANSTQLSWWGSPTYTYVPIYYPTGELFQTSGGTNSSGYSDARNDANISAMHLGSGLKPIRQYQDYLAQQVPMLWFPNRAYQISVISKHLGGITAQDPTGHIYPATWTLKES